MEIKYIQMARDIQDSGAIAKEKVKALYHLTIKY